MSVDFQIIMKIANPGDYVLEWLPSVYSFFLLVIVILYSIASSKDRGDGEVISEGSKQQSRKEKYTANKEGYLLNYSCYSFALTCHSSCLFLFPCFFFLFLIQWQYIALVSVQLFSFHPGRLLLSDVHFLTSIPYISSFLI